jgi:SNF2 family DNA or RNA helicase
MGLGKTLSTCTFLFLFFEHLQQTHQVEDFKKKFGVHPATALIVTPKSTLENWAKEIRMWEKKAECLKPLSTEKTAKDSDDSGKSLTLSEVTVSRRRFRGGYK